ncbi:MAG TPA: hypothetical protein VFQ59_00310 [Candidatus Paceibacterota bacterium]|nr:hypothetical protein [Candidatus Paceibacterota bacterium]
MNTQVKIFVGVIAFLILATVVTVIIRQGSGGPAVKDGQYDSFAQCLTEQGAMFYGTFWCPYCKQQKDMFGSSVKYMPYTECSTPDGQSQTAVCREAEIANYPTWVFADGSRLNGLVPLETLAEKTSCQLPSDAPVDVSSEEVGESSLEPSAELGEDQTGLEAEVVE